MSNIIINLRADPECYFKNQTIILETFKGNIFKGGHNIETREIYGPN